MEQGLYHLAALLFLLGCVSAVGAMLCFWEGRWRFFRGCVVLGAATVAAATVCLLAGLISVRGGDRLQLVESAGKWYVELEPHLLSQAGLSPQVEQAREEIRASYEADAGPDVPPGVWQREFGSWAEAEEFLGLPLTESAALSEEPESPDVARPEDERCTVYLHGRPDGLLHSATVEYRCTLAGVALAAYAHVYFCDEYPLALPLDPEKAEMDWSYEMANGCRAVVELDRPAGMGSLRCSAWFARDDVIYGLFLQGPESEEDLLRAALWWVLNTCR